MRRHLLLIGLPGSGKTTVGELVAAGLGTRFTDVDAGVEREAGATVAELFQREGEPAFREREREAVERALTLSPHVVAPGGGWPAWKDNLARATGQALLVYLAVPLEVAASRLTDDGIRPLLGAGDRRELLQALLAARQPFYRQAGIQIDATAEPSLVAERVVAAARQLAGW